MPNLYATAQEIKSIMPDALGMFNTDYDGLLLRLAEMISRYFDRRTKTTFYPLIATRYFNGDGSDQLWIPDLITLTSLYYSTDDGATYTALAESGNFHLTRGLDLNDLRSANCLVLDPNGDRSTWPEGFRSVKLTGVWGFTEERATPCEDSGIDLSADYTSGGTEITVSDLNADDLFGRGNVLQIGRLIRLGSEYLEVRSLKPVENKAVVLGARNGSTAANHLTGVSVEVWRPPEPVKQAAIIQAVRQLERGLQGFGDTRAMVDQARMFVIKELDPEAEMMLRAYLKVTI